MAHYRPRYVMPLIRDSLGFSPLVGVLGQRQVGKTTLVEQLTSQYVTLDDADVLSAAELTPATFLGQWSGLTAIDECQKAPALFPALKGLVQKDKRPGRFLLTGSVRFTSRKLITESLTGRLYPIEVLPLSASEIARKKLSDFTRWVKWDSSRLNQHVAERGAWFKQGDEFKFLRHGGLPGICFLRKATHVNGKFRAHIQTLLERDLRLILQTTAPVGGIFSLLKFMAQNQGVPFVLKDAVRATGISSVTIKKLIYAFEGLFLIRRLAGEGYSRGQTFFLEDQVMATYLSPTSTIAPELRFAFSQLFAQAHYNHMNEYTASYYESKGGAHVPLVFTIKGKKYGFLFNPGEKILAHHTKTSESLQNHHPGAVLFILSRAPTVLKLSEHLFQMPLLGIV